MRTIDIIDIAMLGFGKIGKAFWLMSEQNQPKMEDRFGLLMDLTEVVKSEAK